MMKNIVFDLGRVVFAQNPEKSSAEYKEFFSYVQQSRMPQFWIDYDMGISSFEQLVVDLSQYRGVSEDYARRMLLLSITRQETLEPTAELIAELKAAGYRLYVLSNMSKEYIAFLRQQSVYSAFEGEVISCEVGCVKPMPEIYDILIDSFSLDVSETFFIDDRPENVAAAEAKGISTFLFRRRDVEGSCRELRELLLPKK